MGKCSVRLFQFLLTALPEPPLPPTQGNRKSHFTQTPSSGPVLPLSGQMAMNAIFGTRLRWSIQGSFNHLFMGSVTCTLRKQILINQPRSCRPHATEETPGHLAEHGSGREHRIKGTCPPALEKGGRWFLGSLYLRILQEPSSQRRVIAISLGAPTVLKQIQRETSQCPLGEGNDRSERTLLLKGKPKAMGQKYRG